MIRMEYGDQRLSVRFWSHVMPSFNGDGCWIWTANRSRSGYGQTKVKKKTKRAHRIAYVAAGGVIPDGMVMDHLCRTRCCVNPAHLEPVTPRENVCRGDSPRIIAEWSRATAGRRASSCKKGHPLSGDNLYVRPKSGHHLCRLCQRHRSQRLWVESKR